MLSAAGYPAGNYKPGAYNPVSIMQVSYNTAYLLGTAPGFRYNRAQWIKKNNIKQDCNVSASESICG
ncbi:hypothetical protein AYY16_01390 [Morganella psychrotolerans]|nr:hypothetical protein AYY16_01390 [Morganella psychrotolerans]